MADAAFMLSSDGVTVEVVVNCIPNGVPATPSTAVGALDGVGTTEIMDNDGSDVVDAKVGLEPAAGAIVGSIVVAPDDGVVVGATVKPMLGVTVGLAVSVAMVGIIVGVTAGVIVGESTATGEGDNEGDSTTGDGDADPFVGTSEVDGVVRVGPLVSELTVGTTVDGEAGCVVKVGSTVSIELLVGVGALVMLLVVGIPEVAVGVGLRVVVAAAVGEEVGAIVAAGTVG